MTLCQSGLSVCTISLMSCERDNKIKLLFCVEDFLIQFLTNDEFNKSDSDIKHWCSESKRKPRSLKKFVQQLAWMNYVPFCTFCLRSISRQLFEKAPSKQCKAQLASQFYYNHSFIKHNYISNMWRIKYSCLFQTRNIYLRSYSRIRLY